MTLNNKNQNDILDKELLEFMILSISSIINQLVE